MGTNEWIWSSALSPAKGVYPNSVFGNWAEICVGRFPGSLLDVAPGVKSFVVVPFSSNLDRFDSDTFCWFFSPLLGDARSSNKGIEKKKRRGSGFFVFCFTQLKKFL